MGPRDPVEAGFRIVGAHTDSPNLRLKSRPSVTKEVFAQLGIQTYGRVLLPTWFDRDLSLAGRVTVRKWSNPITMETRLLRVDRPLCRIPNLTIHLNRQIKSHADWKYANEAESMAAFRGLCKDHAVPVQDFVTRSDLACGNTIGPIVSNSLGIRTVDCCNAIWSMHSIREMAGAQDQPHMVTAMRAFLEWDQRF